MAVLHLLADPGFWLDHPVRAGRVRQLPVQGLRGVPWNLYSIPGMAITEAVALAPIAYIFCANALRQSDASLESAAQVCGAGPLRILFSLIIPMLRPPMVYSSLLVFCMSVETLSVPLLYGQPVGIDVFSTFLYTNGCSPSTPTTASSAPPRRSSWLSPSPGRGPGEATQGRPAVRLRARQGHPAPAPRPGLGPVGRVVGITPTWSSGRCFRSAD